jgi:beta-glucanase (GH16 family)
MEAKGRIDNNIGGTAHYNENGYKFSSGNYGFPDGQTIEGWHEYAVEWSEGVIKWSVDGNLFKTFEYGAPFNAPFYVLLNLAVGGQFDGGKTPPANMPPQRVVVDWVRVYQKG